WSSLSILLALADQNKGRLISTNLHYSKYEGDERYVGCAVPETLKRFWKLIPEEDRTAIPKALSELQLLDLVHYDSAKSYRARMESYPLLWDSLRVGGLFISDDIDDNLAFAHFSRLVSHRPIVVETPQASGVTKYVGVIQKHHDRPIKNIEF
ncbi:MAG: class I SAM-dependent methyltransferase, partial [Planctomycetaceae bacterium]|nr:class I SAM-dependent methyltransferase [Planctomycetaceae bacterium]